MSTDTIELNFNMTNTGDYAGAEIVQLYIRDLLSSVARPVMELKGFQRIYLEKGESKEISFKITSDLLSILDIDLNRIVEPGIFRIMLGSSSNDIRLRGFIEVIE